MTERFSAAMSALLPEGAPARLGVAVSGGGDSMALLSLLAGWAKSRGTRLCAATVDHGLRPETRSEAALAGDFARRLGADHDLLVWDGWDGQGNLQDRARQARQMLLADWAHERAISAICLGHTRDDQAETVLMRLSRGSGVDGLAAMAPSRRDGTGMRWLRPLLGLDSAALRTHLRDQNVTWCEDPSNADPRFNRVRARELLAALGGLGLTAETLTATAERMAAARVVLAGTARTAAEKIVDVGVGDLLVDAAGYAGLADDLRWRILSTGLQWITGNPYRPRFRALCEADTGLLAGKRSTLHGCLVTPGASQHRIGREPKAVQALRAPAPGKWDNRWLLEGPHRADLSIAALGAHGLNAAGGRNENNLPRDSLLASPAVWRDGVLVAAPLLGYGSDWRARLLRGKLAYFEGLAPD